MPNENSKKFDKNNFVTKNNYFQFKKSSNPYTHKIVRRPLRLVNSVLSRFFGVKVISASPRNPELDNYIVDQELKEIKLKNLSLKLCEFFKDGGIICQQSQLQKYIKDFDSLFRNIKLDNNFGGMGYNSGLIIFVFACIVDPKIAYESGVWKGFTTSILDKSTSPECKIYCFDISFANLVLKSDKAVYHECDILEVDLSAHSGQNKFALFDDHVSHFERLNWCIDQRIRYAVFDDDVSPLTVHSDGWPPLPTLDMLFNYLSYPKKFEWVSGNRYGVCDMSDLDLSNLSQKFFYLKMPDLFPFTGYRNTSETSLIILK
jgi:hypothetical protein